MPYTITRVNISNGQKRQIKTAFQNEKDKLTLKFSYQDLTKGDDLMALTKTQINKLEKGLATGKGATITMSKTQVMYNVKKDEGGFLGALLGLATRFLSMIAKTLGLGALSGLASLGVQKAMGNGLYLKKGGYVCSVHPDGKRLYLKNANGLQSRGDGLYLKKESQLRALGSGLLLGLIARLKIYLFCKDFKRFKPFKIKA